MVHHFCTLAYVLLSRDGVNYIFSNALWRRFSLISRAYFSILVSAVVFHSNFITPHESQTEHLPKAYQFMHFPRLEAECHLKLRGLRSLRAVEPLVLFLGVSLHVAML